MRLSSIGFGWLSAAVLCGSITLAACGDSTSDGGGGSGGGQGGAAGGQGEGGSGGHPLTGTPIKILDWNLHNFFDTIEDPSNAPEDDSLSQAEFDAKLDAVAAIISELDPDIIVFQEVENETVLAAIDEALGSAYPEQQITEGHDPRGIDIAALSKVPFTSVVSHATDSFTVEGTTAPEFQFTRDLLEYHFTVGAQKAVLLGVHYKAKGPPDNPDKRLAEAQRTRAVADELTAGDPSLAIIVLGDYNDLPDSPPLDAVAGSKGDYVDSATAIAESDRWTFDFEGSLELIDHQMASPVAQSLLDPSSVTIRHGTDVDAVSDHAPLMATYYFE